MNYTFSYHLAPSFDFIWVRQLARVAAFLLGKMKASLIVRSPESGEDLVHSSFFPFFL
jgi:hypothetical protein